MKKRLLSLLSVAILLASSVLIGCKNETSERNFSPDLYAEKAAPQGYVLGYVVDNRGEPVKDATVALGNKTATTNASGEFRITGVDVNDLKQYAKPFATTVSAGTAGTDTELTSGSTAYAITVTKKGYLSAIVPAVYVTSSEKETPGSAKYQAALKTLSGDYKTILDDYAKVGTTATTTVGTQTADTTAEATTSVASDAKEVMKLIAKAMADMEEDMAKVAYYRDFFSTFAKAVMIPCDAAFSGQVKLQTKPKNSSTLDEKTYLPTSSPVIRAVYDTTTAVAGTTSAGTTNANKGAYTWEAKVGKDGKFSFEGLPSGVSLKFYVDSFFEKINNVEYCFSGESADLMIDNAALSSLSTGLQLKGKNEQSAVFMLYAQVDKIWITATNVDSNSTGKLLKTTDALEFTFSQPMLSLDLSSSSNINLAKGDYTEEWSDDKKSVTITPIDDHWTISSNANPIIKFKGEAISGAKAFLNNLTTTGLTLYFDTKVWVSVADDLTLNDYNDRVALDSPIVIEFSKPMQKEIALTLTGTNTAYEEEWDDTNTKLTLTPVVDYWKVTGANGLVNIKVTAKGGSSKDYYNEEFAYWKRGANTNGGIDVYFDYYVDVTIEEASTAAAEGIKLTFSKPLKTFNKDLNVTSVTANNTALDDYIVTFDKSKPTIVTITSINPTFQKKGKYTINLTGLEADDGSKNFRLNGDKTTNNAAGIFTGTTEFAFDGFILKAVNIEVIPNLPDDAIASRAVYAAKTSDVLKITFNKPIFKSNITVQVGNNTAVTPQNYIDATNACIVYVPLNEVKNVYDKITLGNFTSVIAKDGDKLSTAPSAADLKEWFSDTSFHIYPAITLINTNLAKDKNTASDIADWELDNVIESSKALTFEFSEAPAKVNYTLYRYEGAAAKAEKVDAGFVTPDATTGIATINAKDLIPYAEKADTATGLTEYFIDINAVNEDGVTLFSTTNAWTLNAPANTFENDVAGLFDDGATAGSTDSNLGFGTIAMFVKPVTLVDSNLVSADGTASYLPTMPLYENVIDASSDITFEFSEAPAKVYYTLYRYDGAGNPAVKVDEDVASLNGAVATISASNLIPVADKIIPGTDRLTEYFIDINAVNADDVSLFSTTNPWTLNATEGFEFDYAGLFDDGATAGSTDSNLGFGTIRLAVKPLTLVGTNLYDEEEDALALFAAKSDVTFKFDSAIPTGYKAVYQISKYDVATTTPVVVSTDDASIAGDTVTIPGKDFVIDPANADTTTGISTYWVEFAILDSAADDAAIVFSTMDNFPLPNGGTFESDIAAGLMSQITGTTPAENAFEVDVKPITIIAADALVTRDLSFNEVTPDSYTKADPILPGAPVTLKFSDKFPAQSKIKWVVYDSADNMLSAENVENVAAAKDTFTIQADEMVASTVGDTTYNIWIQAEDKDGNILFSTENPYFGASTDTTDFENALNAKLFVGKDSSGATKYLSIPVVETKILKDDDSDVTTSSEEFAESFKSTIKLQFSHPIDAGYKAVLYATSPIYTIQAVTPPTYEAPNTQTVTGTYDYDYDAWKDKFDLYIYPSTVTVAGDTITIVPTNFFDTNTTVNVAVYDADGNYVDVAGDIPAYTTSAVTSDWVEELLATATTKASETAAADIGNGATIEYKFDTEYSTTSKKLATYQIFVKKAEEVDFSQTLTSTVGFDAEGLPLNVVKYRLGRGDTASIATTLSKNTTTDDDAFGYGGTVDVVIVKKLDGVTTAYKSTFADALKSNLTITLSDSTGYLSPSAAGAIAGTTAVAATGTNDAFDYTTANGNITISIASNEWIAEATVTYTGQTNDGATTPANKTSNATVSSVTYSADNRTATVTLSDIMMFDGDQVTITVKDTSGNVNTTTYTFEQ